MAGILNKKKRFIDLVVTQEGKRQIASGLLRAEYASANDLQADYNKTENYNDATQKLYFETMERPENSIVLEVDDSGKLIQFNINPNQSIVGNKIFDKNNDVAEDVNKIKLASGSQFASLVGDLSSTFINNFKNNYFVGTKDSVNINNEFELSTEDIKFTITNTIPFRQGPRTETVNVNDAEPFFIDKKLTHLPNFQFLPPVNQDGSSYGNYEDFRSLENNSWQKITDYLGNRAFNNKNLQNSEASIDSRDYQVAVLLGDYDNEYANTTMNKEFKSIQFKKTSQNNNLLIQIYEGARDTLTKLDIIDGGVYEDENDPNRNFEKHVFYAGKVYMDNYNTPTFINLFTLIFD